MCAHRLWDEPTGLACDNPTPEPHAHTYSAAWLADRHDESEAA
jgi:hypothetical protein